MKRKFYILILILFFMFIPDVWAIKMPANGRFSCWYDINYKDYKNVEHVAKLVVSGDSNSANLEYFLGHTNDCKDLDCDISKSNFCENDVSANCNKIDLPYASWVTNGLLKDVPKDVSYSMNSNELNISNFIDSSAKWKCSNIRYSVRYVENANIGEVTGFYFDIGNSNSSLPNVAVSINSSIEQSTSSSSNDIIQCKYNAKNIPVIVNIYDNLNKLEINYESYKKDYYNYTSTDCPSQNDFKYCWSNAADKTPYVIYSKTGETCENGYETFDLTFSNNSHNTSDKTCCAYKTANNYIFIYKVKASKTSKDFIYGACFGDSSCITGNLDYTDNVLNLNSPNYKEFKHVDDCSKMPEKIWYTSGNKFSVSSSKPTNSVVLPSYGTIQPEIICSSAGLVYNPIGGPNYDDGNNGNPDVNWGNQINQNCEGILGQDLIDFINKIFRWIQIIAPIAVIVLGGVEFAGAILQDDKDALKKATNKFIKRLIIAVALFFVPLILEMVLNIFNEVTGASSSTCGIGV